MTLVYPLHGGELCSQLNMHSVAAYGLLLGGANVQSVERDCIHSALDDCRSACIVAA